MRIRQEIDFFRKLKHFSYPVPSFKIFIDTHLLLIISLYYLLPSHISIKIIISDN